MLVVVRRAAAGLGALALLGTGAAWSGRADHAVAPASSPVARVARLAEPAVPQGSGASRFLLRTSPANAATVAAASVACTTVRIPNGWCLTPAGSQITTLRFPLGITPTPDQSKVLVSSDSGGVQGLTVVDARTLQAVPSPAANLFMGLSVAGNGKIYASGGNADRVFRYKLVGPAAVPLDLTEAQPVPIHHALDRALGAATLPAVDGIRVPGYPGLSVSDGRYVYVAGTLSEVSGGSCAPAQAACGRVTVIDTTTDTVSRRIPVGLDAYGLAIDPVAHRLYVSNWADEAGRGRGTGTVSVIDITNPAAATEVATVAVGHHPSAVQLSSDRRTLFVANTEDDTVSVIRLSGAAPAVVATQSVAPLAGVPVGAHPDAFALSPDGTTLFVALAGINAVVMLDGVTGAPLTGHALSIPTGWYPSALTVTGTASHYRLWVANAKGVGPGTGGANLSVFGNGFQSQGSVSAIDFPTTSAQVNAWTAQVVANDSLRPAVDVCAPGPDVRRSEVLCPPAGQQSPIKHVVYIVVENKTFDQYFGDLPPSSGYRSDPTWLLYGQPVTPNQHALTGPYSLGDNFFSDAEVSVTGHSWTSGGIATDHNEKTWQADYDQGLRGTHGNGDPLRPSIAGAPGAAIQDAESQLNDPKGGYLFEAFKQAGAVAPAAAAPGRLSMAIYGEHTAVTSGTALDAYKAGDGPWHTGNLQFFDTCRAALFLHGVAPRSALPDQTVGSPPVGFSTNGCGGATIPAAFTLDQWEKTFASSGADTMPSFSYMTLPVNHTLGTNVGSPTFASMVADGDYAIGLIVDALSHSPFWSSTAVMITQDDTQLSGDHVSALRDELQVISPWSQPGPNHQWGSMPALLRTIEHLFGVPPISLYDTLAMPMHEAFRPLLSAGPNLTPYTAVKPLIPFALNQPGLPGAALAAGANWTTVDQVDEQTLTAMEYAAIRGWPLSITGPHTATVSPPKG